MKALPARCALVAMLLAAAIAGCSALSSKPMLDSAAGMFDKADVSYRVPASKIAAADRSSRQVEGQLVSYQTIEQNPLPADAVADVQIEYPHPKKRTGYAQVTVRIFTGGSSGDAGRLGQWWQAGLKWTGLAGEGTLRETWMLDIPQNELAGIINDLHNSGYFTSYDKPAAGAAIETKLDGAKVSKTWRQVPELDALVLRVRSQGRLLSSPKGEADKLFQGLAGKKPSSVQAYRELHEEEGVALVSDQTEPAPIATPQFQIVRLPAVQAGSLR